MNAYIENNLHRQFVDSKEYQIFLDQCCSKKVDPLTAEMLFPKIKNHKWILSEKLHRDVGMKVATLDYLENEEPLDQAGVEPSGPPLIAGLEAERIERSVWDTIADSQPPKQVVNRSEV